MIYSNEIVFRGHPDKVCDQISDALLDAYLEEDKNSRCGIEVVGGKGLIVVTGEVTSIGKVDVEKTVKRVLKDIGYKNDYKIINNLGIQSADIALGTNEKVMGAGDQGMMFGYATNETKEYLPKAMVILQKLSMAYDELRKKESDIFYPDGKAQITGYYDENMHLKKIKTFLISYNNSEEKREYSDQKLIDISNKICKEENVEVEEYIINPTGKFKIGGFEGDSGLTGRKIVVDSYHSFAKVGGGAFSGKDPSKVDRSAAYKARQIAVETLKQNNLKWCEVQLSYAIGLESPLAIYITSDKGNITVNDSLYEECKPRNIIKDLNLKNIKYEPLAMFGHFK
jgi:S-adenosylmethionine synthetase